MSKRGSHLELLVGAVAVMAVPHPFQASLLRAPSSGKASLDLDEDLDEELEDDDIDAIDDEDDDDDDWEDDDEDEDDEE